MTANDSRPPPTHGHVVLVQEDGELAEDDAATRELDRTEEVARRRTRVAAGEAEHDESGGEGDDGSDEIEEQSKETFPASEAPSSWGGGEDP